MGLVLLCIPWHARDLTTDPYAVALWGVGSGVVVATFLIIVFRIGDLRLVDKIVERVVIA